MSLHFSDAAIVSLKVVAAAATIPATGYMVPMWGVSASTFGLAAIGAAMAYAWDAPEADRRVVIFKTVSVTLFAVACVVVLPDLAGWDLVPRSEPPLAFIIATFGRHIIPALRKAAPAIGQGIAGMFTKRDNYGGFNDAPPPSRDYEDDPRRDDKNPPGGY